MAYTKLFASLITSTVWLEPDATRIVWITMLAIANKHGEVEGSVPGLARLAGVSVEACDVALATFLAPDPRSRTKTDEGRRIEEIDGGWLLVNYEKYRRMSSLDDEREKAAERQRRFRERHHGGALHRNGGVTPEPDKAEADSEAEAEAKREKRRGTSTDVAQAVSIYNEIAGTGNDWPKASTILSTKRAAALAKVLKHGGLPAWREALERACRSDFLAGRKPRSAGHEGWRASIDYLARLDVFVAINEGSHDNPTRPSAARASANRADKPSTMGKALNALDRVGAGGPGKP